jgi:hypothetical protein
VRKTAIELLLNFWHMPPRWTVAFTHDMMAGDYRRVPEIISEVYRINSLRVRLIVFEGSIAADVLIPGDGRAPLVYRILKVL